MKLTVYRDEFGIPSIDAPTSVGAAYGVGYAMAQDCAARMAQLYLSARGRSAEVVGAIAVQMDYLVRALGIEDAARRDVAALTGQLAEIVESFCSGANRAIREQEDSLPQWVRPIDPVDVLALTHLSNVAFPLLALTSQLTPGSGSNQFAVAGRLTAAGHAIVSIDPHLDWDKAISWYEFSSYTPEHAIKGIAVCGIPMPIMGHNSRVAWSMTNNDPMLYALYSLDVDPSDPTEYNYHGDRRKFLDGLIAVDYVDSDGMRQTERIPSRMTEWGPVIAVGGQACALYMPLGNACDTLNQALKMASARNVREFREALRPLGLTMWNFVFADVEGGLAYQYNARVHRRDPSFDWSNPVPGGDPRTRWSDPIPLDELPNVMNPASGVLINANSSPWLTALSGEITDAGWPSYVTSHPRTFRYERLAKLLSGVSALTVDSAMSIATDTLAPAGRQVRDILTYAAAGSAEIQDALLVLAAWDGRADIDSRGTALYRCWLMIDGSEELAVKLLHGETWTPAETIAAIGALREAAAIMRMTLGSVEIPWGDVHVSRRNGREAPVSGFGGAVTPNTGPLVDGKIACDFGSSFRMIIELDPAGIRSWSAKPYGNAQNPASPHSTDQMELFGRGEYKGTLFGVQRIQAKAVDSVELTV